MVGFINCVVTFVVIGYCNYFGSVLERFSIDGVESNFAFALVLSLTTLCDWLPKFAPLSQPMRSKTKTNRASVARFFPRLAPVACICFKF